MQEEELLTPPRPGSWLEQRWHRAFPVQQPGPWEQWILAEEARRTPPRCSGVIELTKPALRGCAVRSRAGRSSGKSRNN